LQSDNLLVIYHAFLVEGCLAIALPFLFGLSAIYSISDDIALFSLLWNRSLLLRISSMTVANPSISTSSNDESKPLTNSSPSVSALYIFSSLFSAASSPAGSSTSKSSGWSCEGLGE
jgi:hypothetical protein